MLLVRPEMYWLKKRPKGSPFVPLMPYCVIVYSYTRDVSGVVKRAKQSNVAAPCSLGIVTTATAMVLAPSRRKATPLLTSGTVTRRNARVL